MTERNERFTPGWWIAPLLIVIGFLFLTHTLNIFNFGKVVATWWPLVLIVIGFSKLRRESKTGGALLFVLGIVFLSATLDIVNWGNVFRFWPLVLIFIGVSLLLKRRGGPWGVVKGSEQRSEDAVKTSAILGGVSRVVSSSSFRGGEVMALFGGVELDLREVKVSPEGCELNLTALFGGVEVIVPRDWRVSISGTPILGGIEDKTRFTREEEKETAVTCRCTVAFGRVEIRN
ncbi:MAG: DUF5668 domain-containing protein [Candidatus Neomarinimicrobiota bacterium]